MPMMTIYGISLLTTTKTMQLLQIRHPYLILRHASSVVTVRMGKGLLSVGHVGTSFKVEDRV
jgi:hypothetical protein